MHRRTIEVLAVIVLCVAAVAPSALAATVDWQAFDWDRVYRHGGPVEDGMLLPGRLLVRFAPGAVPTSVAAKGPGGAVVTGVPELDRVAADLGLFDLERQFDLAPTAKKLPGDDQLARYFVAQYDSERRSLREAAAALGAVPGIELVEPDPMHFQYANLPNDPALGSQWWLRNTALGSKDIRALAAWYHHTGSSNVIVCAADSGTDWQHPDLGGTGPNYLDGVIWINQAELNGNPGVDDDFNTKIDDIRGWDFVTGVTGEQNPPQDVSTQDNDPMDYDGHGTWVAGCMSAITNNGIGVASTNWNAKIMICRIGWLPEGSSLGVVGMSFAAQALQYARINGAHVFNASWGSSNIASLRDAANLATQAGMVIVAAAGNDNNTDAAYLNSRSDVISVAATTQSDAKASFSSYGTWVDISAPGVSIYTTAYDRFASGGAQHTYSAPQGTSFASPIVAGAFALAKAAYPGDTRAQWVARVLAAVDDHYGVNSAYLNQLGSGRLNVAKLFDNPMWLVPDQLPGLVDAFNTADDGDSIAVVGGTVLTSRVALPNRPVDILGGWDATFSTRDPVGNPSILQPSSGSGPVLSALGGIGASTVFDGFRISNGSANFISFEPVDGYYGGGILVRDSSPTLRNLVVSGNVAGQSNQYGAGGGIAILGGSPRLENVQVRSNTSLRGAGIYVHEATPTFVDVVVENNVNYTNQLTGGARGGGVFVLNAPVAAKAPTVGQVLFQGGTISGHDVSGPGGGLYCDNSDVRLEGTTIRSNLSTGDGAGVYSTGGTLEVVDAVFTANQIKPGNFTSGGGLYTNGTAATVSGSLFSQNVAGFNGGGMSLNAMGSSTVTGSFVVDNASSILGTGAHLTGATAGASFVGNTVAKNTGGSSGANGVYLGSGSIAFTRNIVALNGTAVATLADGFHVVAGATPTFDCNLVFGNVGGNYGGVTDPTGTGGNISEDPLFCDATGGVYTISVSSPAAAAPCGAMGAGATDCGGTDVETPVTPRRAALAQNVPNPFNPTTKITFAVPARGGVSLRVFDLRGRLVRVLAEGVFEPGEHHVAWDGTDDLGRTVASGSYFYELQADGERKVRKMGLLK